MQLKPHNRYDYSPIEGRKDYSWPEGKRIAFYCALNVEHFSFGEGLGHTPTSPGPQPDVRNFGWRDYGLRVGIWRVFDMMQELGLPLAHLINASIAEHMPQIVAKIRERGDEIVGHGYSNSVRQVDMTEAEEAAMIKASTEILERAFGVRPYGWMGPWISETAHTPDLLQEAGYTYFMDWPADDQPFNMRTRGGKIMAVPYPIEINDTPVMLSRMQPATDFYQMIKDQFEEMLRLSERHPLVFGVSMHTFCTGQPFRLVQVRKALQEVLAHPEFQEKVWITTPGKIAEYAATLPEGVLP